MASYTSPTEYLGLSKTELNAPGGQSTIQGGYRSGYNAPIPAASTPATAPTPTYTAPAPAMATAPVGPDRNTELERIKNEALSIQEILNGRQENSAGNLNTGSYEEVYQPDPFDEDAATREATRNQMKLYQAEIDATNQVYDQLLNEARVQGTGRLGSQRAGAARGGLLGSDFASSQKATVQDFNTQEQRGIGAERTAAIGNIMGKVRQSALDEVAAKRAARTAGAEEYMDFLSRRGERREEFKTQLVNDALTQGFDLTQLTEEELAQYLDKSGVSAADLLASYQTAKAQAEAPDRENQFTLKAGEKRFDSAGNVIAEGPADAKDFGTIYSTGQGLVRVDPETGEPNLIFASAKSGGGSGGGSGETFKSGGLTISGSEVSELENDFAGLRDPETGKLEADTYDTALTNWRSEGGLEADFYKLFPPKDWLSTSDPTLPPHLKGKMGSSGSYSFSVGGTTVDLSAGATDGVPEDGAITQKDSPWYTFWD